MPDAGSAAFPPILKGSAFNAAIVANTDLFTVTLNPTNSPTTFRIYACFNTAGILVIRRTSGTVTVSEQLNGGVALAANSAYMFDILVEAGETINIQYTVNATLRTLKVVEVPGFIS